MYPGAIKGIYIIDDRPTGRVSDYQSFIVDPLVVYLNPSAKAYSMPKDKLETVAKEFAQELVKALNERYSVVEQPGTGVLRIKAALTDIKANGSIGQIEKNSMLEIDFIDSSTDKRVVAFIADMQGRSFRDFTRELVARIAELQRKTKAYTVP